ncbi:MAG TPA: DUF3391 domain-containing protein [Sphingomicrobium sp.]|nr:DUF3391 domain-containing protein [Sphingomicrobium sp.]
MLFRVNPGEVQIGMFIHAFEGRWIDHPFWRSRFLVETDEQLARIRASGVDALVIDRSRSRMAADGTPDAALPERRVRDIPPLGTEQRNVTHAPLGKRGIGRAVRRHAAPAAIDHQRIDPRRPDPLQLLGGFNQEPAAPERVIDPPPFKGVDEHPDLDFPRIDAKQHANWALCAAAAIRLHPVNGGKADH